MTPKPYRGKSSMEIRPLDYEEYSGMNPAPQEPDCEPSDDGLEDEDE